MSTQTAPPTPPPAGPSTPTHSRRIWLVLAIVVAVGVVTWLVTRGDDDGDKGGSSADNGVQIGTPTVLSEDALRAFGRSQPVPVYWAGPQPNRRYELTKTKSGRYYVRYLTPKASVGDASPRFLTVGTYPGTNAYGALQVVGRRKGTKEIRTRSGALVVYAVKQPTSVYFAFPNQNFQVEVYDPRGASARRVVLDGRVKRLN